MKINFKLLNRERIITVKKFFIVLVELLFIFCLVKLLQYHVGHVNDDEIAKMKVAIPYVKTMEGTENLPEKMEMISKATGLYYGKCYVDESADEKEIVRHYKREFEKNGWNYIGRFYWKDIHPERNVDERYYCFEKEGSYWMYLCLQMNEYVHDNKTRVTFFIDLKEEGDDRKYCKIEDE